MSWKIQVRTSFGPRPRCSRSNWVMLAEISDSIQAANIGATVAELQHSLESFNVILDSLNSGSGTIGKLMQDEALYNNLTDSAKELEELLKEVKEHPKRFVHLSVFGRKEKPYEEPVKE